MQEAGANAVLVEHYGQFIGAVVVRDDLRPEAVEVVVRLRADRYTVAMLTGDEQRPAAAIAAQAGITDVHTDPADKSAIITRLREKSPTATVGDGVNDAPVLATADVGIAMGATGADVAIETAGIALMGERPTPPTAHHEPRAPMAHNHAAHVGLSQALMTVLIPLAAFGIVELAALVLVHEPARIVVIANGVRAGRALPPTPAPQPAVPATAGSA